MSLAKRDRAGEALAHPGVIARAGSVGSWEPNPVTHAPPRRMVIYANGYSRKDQVVMLLYDIALFVHLLGPIALFSAFAVLQRGGARLRHAGTVDRFDYGSA